MQEVGPDIYRIEITSRWPLIKPPVNLYVVAGCDGLLWDAGYGRKADVRRAVSGIEAVARNQKEKGRPFAITRLIPSHGHGDHFAGLSALRKHTGGRVLLTENLARKIKSADTYTKSWQTDTNPVSPRRSSGRKVFAMKLDRVQEALFGMAYLPDPDRIIPETTTLSVGGRVWQIFPIPGHADDHLALYNAETGILMTGDHVMPRLTPWMGPPRSSIRAYEASLIRLLQLPKLTRLLPAHGSPVDRAEERIQDALAHSKKRTERVFRMVNENNPDGLSFKEVVLRVYPVASRTTRISGEGWILLTLQELVDSGRIKAASRNGDWRFLPI